MAEEFSLLIAAADTGPVIQKVSGPDRAILYIVRAYTGFRRNEIASVTTRSFDFDSDPPTLTVKAGYSKHRRTDVIPLRADFAVRIQNWITGKKIEPNERLFGIADKRTAEMIKKDLEAARADWLKDAEDNAAEFERRTMSSFLAYENEHGHVIDFHSLRSTFITSLTRSGVSPKTAQMLARHSDINLTMNTYTMLGVMDQVAAVESLPSIPVIKKIQSQEALRASGTDSGIPLVDGQQKVPTVVPRGAENGAKQLASRELRIAPTCTDEDSDHNAGADQEVARNAEEHGVSCAVPQHAASIRTKMPEVGLEPTLGCPNWILSPARLPFRHSGCECEAHKFRRSRHARQGA